MNKEEKIASYTEPKKRIQLLKVTEEAELPTAKIRYQIRINRRIVDNTISEGIARRRFAWIITSEILQQKFSL